MKHDPPPGSKADRLGLSKEQYAGLEGTAQAEAEIERARDEGLDRPEPVMQWKEEDEAGGIAIGPVWFEGVTDEDLAAVGLAHEQTADGLWMRKDDALVVAAKLGARFEEV